MRKQHQIFKNALKKEKMISNYTINKNNLK